MNSLSYDLYEMAYAAMAPSHALSNMTRMALRNPFNPLSYTSFGKRVAASAEMWERMTRRYGKPGFELPTTTIDGRSIRVEEDVVWERPFCRLLHFARRLPPGHAPQPKLLIVAPMSGHYATLLRGTVDAMLPHFEVYITDWNNARLVPLAAGSFNLDNYVDYLIEIFQHLGPGVHSVGVCQPAVPLIVAAARMGEEEDPCAPASMVLMGGPIDTRESPTEVNKLAEQRGVEWFRQHCLVTVPFPYLGAGRIVYPGFLQLSGFMAMNLDRHMTAHVDMFRHLVKGDGDSADKHREFYDEYLAVMDLTAEYYMQTIETVFVNHALPKGEMTHHGRRVDLKAIRKTALMTVEGENDDISGVGQTYAAHALCANLPDAMRAHYVQKGVGHYGVFNGSKFRANIVPRICAFVANVDRGVAVDEGSLGEGSLVSTQAELPPDILQLAAPTGSASQDAAAFH